MTKPKLDPATLIAFAEMMRANARAAREMDQPERAWAYDLARRAAVGLARRFELPSPKRPTKARKAAK